MKQLLIILIFAFITTQTIFAQKENNTWFLNAAKIISFNETPPTIDSINSYAINFGYNTTVSDSNGDLLFFSDGIQIFDKNAEIMPNGDSLQDNIIFFYDTAIQPVLTIPIPNTSDKYYLFTIMDGKFSFANFNDFLPGRLHYSIIDMNLNNGKGDIIPTQKNIFLTDNLAGNMVAARGICGSVWVVVHEINSNRFLAYEITESGIAPPIISEIGATILDSNILNTELGPSTLAFSPNHDKLVCFNAIIDSTQLFNFDRETGTISNPIHLHIENDTTVAGAFSSDGTKFYTTESLNNGTTQIVRFDVNSNDASTIQNSKSTVGIIPRTGFLDPMQLAPDGNIYGNVQRIIYIISNANADFVNNVIITDSLFIANNSVSHTYNLPNLVVTPSPPLQKDSLFLPQDTSICDNQTVILNVSTIGETYLWQNGDTTANFNIDTPGTYSVEVQKGNCTFRDTILVTPFESNFSLPSDTLLCEGEEILLSIEEVYKNIIWQDGSTHNQYSITESGEFWVSAFQNDCPVSDSINVEFENCNPCEVMIPNTFTPNNDGINDEFGGIFLDDCKLDKKVHQIIIWSRWGEKVFFKEGDNPKWDGHIGNKPAIADVYFYQIETIDENDNKEKFRGDVLLIN